MNKDIKIIISDMDGTLLNSNHEINNEFWDIYKKLKEKKILFCAASGRQYFNLLELFSEIRDDIIFVAENGTYVVYQNKELYSNCLDSFHVKYCLEKLNKIKNIGIILCGKDKAYIENSSSVFIEQVEKYYKKYEIVNSLKDIVEKNTPLIKIAVYDFENSEKNCYPYFSDDIDKFKVVVSGKNWLDIMNITSDKGDAINRILEKINIKKEEAVAFGDYLNDLELLQNVEHSFAMSNAHPEIKKIAKYICKSNNENGVVEAIKNIIK